MNRLGKWLLLMMVAFWTLGLPGKELPGEIQRELKKNRLLLDWQYLDDAEVGYNKILGQCPQAAGIHEALGYIQLQRASHADAVRHFQAELQIEPGNDVSHFLLAIAFYLSGDMNMAKSSLDEVHIHRLFKSDPLKKFLRNNPGLYEFLHGLIHQGEGDFTAAEMELRRALEKGYRKTDVVVHLFNLGKGPGSG